MTLKEIGCFYGGLSGKSKTDFENGNAKFITYMNVFSNIAVNTDIQDFVKISESEKQNKVKVGDIIFTGSSETPEECGMSCVLTEKTDENLYLNSFCFGLRLNDEYKELLSPEFSKHLFRSKEIRKQIVQTASGVTRFNVSKKRMEKVKIPIPPLAEQNRIVKILDKFDALVNDISAGLPAEIKMRRVQYEYYRNKCLNFDLND
jgi:type I restriction enzyme S subunit